MKSLLLLSAIFTSGGAVAVQHEAVEEKLSENMHRLRQMFERKHGYDIESIREFGYPYPNEERLAELTEEQAFAITSFIDQVNADYDFTSMTDEEIEDALVQIREELRLLHEELGLEYHYGHPGEEGLRNAMRARQERGRGRGRGHGHRGGFDEEDEVEDTEEVPSEEEAPEEDVIDEDNANLV